MTNTVSTANFIAVPAKVDSVYGLEETASALVEDTLTVNQLGDERLGHLYGRGSHLELRIRSDDQDAASCESSNGRTSKTLSWYLICDGYYWRLLVFLLWHQLALHRTRPLVCLLFSSGTPQSSRLTKLTASKTRSDCCLPKSSLRTLSLVLLTSGDVTRTAVCHNQRH